MKNCKENKEFKLLIWREDGVYEAIDYTVPYCCILIIFSILIVWSCYVSGDYYAIPICLLLLPLSVRIIIDLLTNFGLKKIK